MPQTTKAQPESARARNAALRRHAIVNAALDEFVEKGFAAGRVEDIARRAGVAKGTVYLHFSDKEALFEAIIKQEIRPNIDALASFVETGASLHDFLQSALLPALTQMLQTRRGAVLRLLIGEAGRFPKLAKVYFRLVIEPGLKSIGVLLARAAERGELRDRLLLDFPQLLMAPMLLSLIWSGLFESYRHLNAENMVRAYFEHMLSGTGTKAKRGKA